MFTGAVSSISISDLYKVLLACDSPKPELPPATAYEPLAPPSNRDLGPPPPGYGRYADFDGAFRGGGPGGVGRGGPSEGGPRRNLEEVLCFKVSMSKQELIFMC
jgi:hypothetical protein